MQFVFILAGGLAFGQTGTQPITVIRAQHFRLPTPAPILRIAVGDADTVSAEALNNREILLLGKTPGRTSLLIWYSDGSLGEHIVTVQRDLSTLQAALKRIHPSIEAEAAPDRDAIVLTGLVPDLTYRARAEDMARDYLKADPNNRVLLMNEPAQPNAPSPNQPPPLQQPGAAPQPAQPGSQSQPQTPFPGPVRIAAFGAAPVAVINLIDLQSLPPLIEQKITEAIRTVGGASVRVRRVVRGPVRDDAQDLFILEGRVADQVTLTRILSVAATLVTGQAADAQNIQVVADEAGGLTNGAGGAGGGGGGGGLGGGIGGGGTGGSGGNLNNQVRRNIARAKVLQVGGGRILSFLDVADIPQVRVDIRLYEINRSKVRQYSPNIISQIGQRVPVAAGTLGQALTGSSAPLGADKGLQQLLGFLGGTINTETQLTTGRFALDAIFSYLEQVGLARSLSSPSLTVLSGEQAQFTVGGDIPVPQSFAPAFGGTNAEAAGVFNSVVFVNFGITLSVRPLVGEEDTLTLDVFPQVSTPDTTLTATIRNSSGTNPATTAFQTRSLRTSARLQDGQLLVIGGLLSHNTNDTQTGTPGLKDVPGLGWLFKNLNQTDDSQELIIVVNPVIVRDPIPGVALWDYPSTEDLITNFTRGGTK
jgi:pilus assembly protein CpaC